MQLIKNHTMRKSGLQKKRAGFSILEVLLAMFILVVGLLATLQLTAGSIRETVDSRDSLVAAGLAQEGVELVRNVRDNNAAQAYFDRTNDADDGNRIFDGFDAGNCIVSYDLVHYKISNKSGVGINCSPGAGDEDLSLVADGSFPQNYVHGSGARTPFKRRIILEFDGVDTLNVVSMVTWNGRELQSNKANCRLSDSCVYDETTLTRWILH